MMRFAQRSEDESTSAVAIIDDAPNGLKAANEQGEQSSMQYCMSESTDTDDEEPDSQLRLLPEEGPAQQPDIEKPLAIESGGESAILAPDKNGDNESKVGNVSPPNWFLENCVKRYQQLKSSPTNLLQRSVKDTGDDSFNTTEIKSGGKIHIDRLVHQAIYVARSSKSQGMDKHKRSGLDKATNKNFKFRRGCVYIRHPDHILRVPPPPFFEAVIETYDVELEADLVTLRGNDILDLVQYFASSIERKSYMHIDTCMSMSFDINEKELDHVWQKAKRKHQEYPSLYADPGAAPISPKCFKHLFPFATLLKSAQDRCQTAPLPNTPLIVHIPNIQHYLERRASRIHDHPNIDTKPKIVRPFNASNPFTYDLPRPLASRLSKLDFDIHSHSIPCLLSAIKQLESVTNVLVIATSSGADSKLDAKIPSLIGAGPRHKALCILPLCDTANQDSDGPTVTLCSEICDTNTRAIKRAPREGCDRPTSSILQPYTPWTFFHDICSDYNFSKRLLTPNEAEELSDHIGGVLDPEKIYSSMVNAAQREVALGFDDPSIEQPLLLHGPEPPGSISQKVQEALRWSSLDPEIRAKIVEIERSPKAYNWGRQAFEFIVMPGKLVFNSMVQV